MSSQPEEKPKPTDIVNQSSVGTDLAACVIVGLVLGWLCNKFFPATAPWGFLACFFLGIAAGFWQLFKKTGGK